MPDEKKVQEVLASAGFAPCKIYKPRAGRAARNIPGYRIQALAVERRALYVFHVGRGEQKAVPEYEKALLAAGYTVTRERGGLRVKTSRNPADRIAR